MLNNGLLMDGKIWKILDFKINQAYNIISMDK